MYRVAIVEDEWESFESIRKCFEEYTKEYGEAFNIIRFKNGMYFLGAYSSNFDIVIMDIDMPQMNGIQTAADLRKVDDKVVLIFVTFLAKYAIKGYAVDALDYVVKPVNYHTFKLKIARAIERCRKNARGRVFAAAVYVGAEGGELHFLRAVGEVHCAGVFIYAVHGKPALLREGGKFFGGNGRAQVYVRRGGQPRDRVTDGASHRIEREVRFLCERVQFFGDVCKFLPHKAPFPRAAGQISLSLL